MCLGKGHILPLYRQKWLCLIGEESRFWDFHKFLVGQCFWAMCEQTKLLAVSDNKWALLDELTLKLKME
jgi:hypothetical protein